MANRNTKARNRWLRKNGEFFHGKPCDTSTDRDCRRPKVEVHDFVANRERILKDKGLL